MAIQHMSMHTPQQKSLKHDSTQGDGKQLNTKKSDAYVIRCHYVINRDIVFSFIGRHCRMETPRVRFPASHSRPIHPPINIVPNAWQNANMAYTDQGNNVVTRQNRHPSNPVGPFPGVAPWPRPFLPNNWPTPPPMGISAVQNPSAVNPMGPMPGVAPFPLPSSSNTWHTPLTMNVGPNTWEKNNVPDMEHGFWIPAEQNPFPHNYIGSGPMQVQQLSPYPTGL